MRGVEKLSGGGGAEVEIFSGGLRFFRRDKYFFFGRG